jgi:phenylpyruvate tautomerase PptA (4-oxalocrotonate tautomerase family)
MFVRVWTADQPPTETGARSAERRQTMPTYTIWAEPGVVPTAQRGRIATALTEIHHDVAIAPRYFVQVVFTELTPDSIYIAGRAATRPHVWIRADIRAGRTDEQKRKLLDRITTEVGQIVNAAPEEIWVYICDIPGGNIAEYGRALPDPGMEEAWFAALPPDLREALGPLR